LESRRRAGILDGDIENRHRRIDMNTEDREHDQPEQPDEEPTTEEPTTEPPVSGPEDPTHRLPPTEGPQAPAAGATGGGAGAGPGERRIRRSRQDRVIGGVCGGLGRYFNTDPIFFRIGFIALAFLGGAGLLLYLAALLLMPAEDSGAAVVGQGGEGRNRALVIAGVVVILLFAWPFLLGGGVLAAGLLIPLAILVGAGVLVWWLVSGEGPSGEPKDIARRAALGVGILILCGMVALAGAFAAAAGPDWLVAVVVIAAGAAVIAGAFLKPIRWLVLPALALALAAGTVAAAGIDLDGGVGDREYRPASSADLKDRYELGIGDLTVDLRDTELPSGDVPLEFDLGMGEARLVVPEDICVATKADVGMGNVSFFGRDNGGIDVDFDDRPDAGGDATRILLDAEIGLGELRVSHDDFWGGRGAHFGPGRDELDADQAGNSACATTGQSASG
jgi:phage shock protein PspC (stress-responsive transcriptional regulator)